MKTFEELKNHRESYIASQHQLTSEAVTDEIESLSTILEQEIDQGCAMFFLTWVNDNGTILLQLKDASCAELWTTPSAHKLLGYEELIWELISKMGFQKIKAELDRYPVYKLDLR